MPVHKRRLLGAALGLVLILAVCLPEYLSPHPAPSYRVTDLGVLPGYTTSSAIAVNSRGDAAGTISGANDQAAVFQGGRVTSLGILPTWSGSEAHGINSQGDVTGIAWLPNAHHAFLYSRGKMRDLGILPGFTDSAGTGINDRGEVTGDVTNTAGVLSGHAFLYRKGRMTDLGVPVGCSVSHARSINTIGQIVGYCLLTSSKMGRTRPFLYDSRTRTMTVLALPAPYRLGWAKRINDGGQIIGDVWKPGGSPHAVLWHGNQMTDLGIPSGFNGSHGSGLNNRGEAVGWCYKDGLIQTFLWNYVPGDTALRRYLDHSSQHAFVYYDGKMQDLNELIPRDADWTLEDARDINDRGQIVGRGLHHGQERAFLLTPLY